MSCSPRLCVECQKQLQVHQGPGLGPVTCGDECRKRRSRKFTDRSIEKRRQARRKSDADVVACMVCGAKQEVISHLHLATHGLTVKEYREKYPDAPMMGSSMKASRSKGVEGRRKWTKYGGKEPDKKLFSFLTGTMLGDGSLENQVKTARYCEGGKNQFYLKHKRALLAEYFPTTFKHRFSKPDKRTGKSYEGWWVRTCGHPLLKEWHTKWYPAKKSVCRELVLEHLDPLALAFWFYDDGHLSPSGACLYTMAFAKEDVEFLSGLLKDRFDIDNWVRENEHGQFYIYVGAKGRPRLLEVIGQHPMPGMAYKLGCD
jgi:hypothetical protein